MAMGKTDGWKKRMAVLSGLVLIGAGVLFGAGFGCDEGATDDDDTIIKSSRAYKGHESDADINALVQAFPRIRGTRLDDCQTCHLAGTVTDKKGNNVTANPCAYCHYVLHPPAGWTNLPTTYLQTLNPFGVDYLDAGRDKAAVLRIKVIDSDRDGFSNAEEILDQRYPGFDGSYPGLAQCPVIKVTLAEIQALPKVTMFTFSNTSRQQYDFYATYAGVKISDILAAKGIDLTGATNIDILSPDGFKQTFTVDEITQQYPQPKFFTGFGLSDLGSNCAFVEYPANTYGLASGETIHHPQWHILAYEREGQLLEPSYLDPVSGKINGEGPFRNIIPPWETIAMPTMNEPDRGENWDTTGCTFLTWNYDAAKDHNAGRMAKAAVIIRILPMPAGCEEFDLVNGGFSLVDEQAILIYGNNVGP